MYNTQTTPLSDWKPPEEFSSPVTLQALTDHTLDIKYMFIGDGLGKAN